MADRDSAADVLTRLRDRDDEAATQLYRRFTHRLIALARTHLDSWAQKKDDPEDVVQSVYKSFFARFDAGQFAIDSWDDLWSLLTLITLRKCADRIGFFRAQRRDTAREVPASGLIISLAELREAVDREPTPEEAAILTETVEQVLRGLEADDREVIELSLQGYSVAEITARLRRTERTVQRLRQRVRERLERLQEA